MKLPAHLSDELTLILTVAATPPLSIEIAHHFSPSCIRSVWTDPVDIKVLLKLKSLEVEQSNPTYKRNDCSVEMCSVSNAYDDHLHNANIPGNCDDSTSRNIKTATDARRMLQN